MRLPKQYFAVFLLCSLVLLCSTTLVTAENSCVFCKSSQNLKRLRYPDGLHPVCYSCRKHLPLCTLCGNPTASPPYRDGRNICRFCKRTGIFHQEQLEQIYTSVRKFVQNTLKGLSITPPPPVKLADLDEIQTKFSETGRSMEVGGFYRPYNPEMIYILSGYQPEECAAVLVHEYTHAWQSRNCPLQDRALKEGFATWVEYKYLMSIGRPRKAFRLTQKNDPDYGASLIKLLAYEKKTNPHKVIEYARTHKKLP